MPIVTSVPSLQHRNSAAVIALTSLRRAGIPVPGLGVAAAPKRRGLPVRLSGNVSQPFGDSSVMVRDINDELDYWAESWTRFRPRGDGYADPLIERDPARCASGLRDQARDYCNLYSNACNGFDVEKIIAENCAAFSAAFQAQYPKGWAPTSQWEGRGYYTQSVESVSDLSYQSGGGNQTGYTVPNTITPTYGTTPTAAVTGNTGGGGVSSAPPASATGNGASGPVVLTLRNTSRPGSPLASGDSFDLVITGPAYSPVTIEATRNGTQRGVSDLGQTDGQGLKIIGGRMSDSEIGSWVEVVKVANSSATISFSVGAAPGMTTGGGPAAVGSGSATGGGSSTAIPGAGSPAIALLPSSLPSWAIPAAIAAAAFLMLRK